MDWIKVCSVVESFLTCVSGALDLVVSSGENK